MQDNTRETDAVLLLVLANAFDDPVEAVGFAGRTWMRHDDLGDIAMVPDDFRNFALSIGIVDISTYKDVEIPVVDAVDRIHQGAPNDISLLPSWEHQGEWLLRLCRHVFKGRLAMTRA